MMLRTHDTHLVKERWTQAQAMKIRIYKVVWWCQPAALIGLKKVIKIEKIRWWYRSCIDMIVKPKDLKTRAVRVCWSAGAVAGARLDVGGGRDNQGAPGESSSRSSGVSSTSPHSSSPGSSRRVNQRRLTDEQHSGFYVPHFFNWIILWSIAN